MTGIREPIDTLLQVTSMSSKVTSNYESQRTLIKKNMLKCRCCHLQLKISQQFYSGKDRRLNHLMSDCTREKKLLESLAFV